MHNSRFSASRSPAYPSKLVLFLLAALAGPAALIGPAVPVSAQQGDAPPPRGGEPGQPENGAAARIDFEEVRAREELRWGVQAFHRGLFNEAILSLERSLAYRPEQILARIWLGRSYFRSGFEDAALAEWRTVMESGNGSALLQNRIDLITYRRGLARELRRPERFVVADRLEGKPADYTLFQRPTTVRPRPDGSSYLVSYASSEILVLDADGNLRQRLRDGVEGFDRPFDVVEAGGSLFVSEYRGNRIAKTTLQGFKTMTFGTRGSGDGGLLGPQYLADDGNGYLYVSDWGNRRIAKFDHDGRFILSFGKRTAGYPGLLAPTGVLAYRDRIYVADRIRRHIAVFDPSGNFLGTLAEGLLNAPEGLSLLGDSLILIADTSQVLALDIDRDTVTRVTDLEGEGKRILGAARDANGNLLVADFDGSRLSVLSEISSMYSGLSVRIERIDAEQFPRIAVELSVEDRLGNPIQGLREADFLLSEGRVPVNAELVYAGFRDEAVHLSLVVERSPRMQRFGRPVRDAVAAIAAEASGNVRVITAGRQPVRETAEGDGPLRAAEAAAGAGAFTDDWRFDLGVRMGTAELIPVGGKRAVVFLSTGDGAGLAFPGYGLLELMQFMRNSGVRFFPVYVGDGAPSEELEYLAKETGGRSFRLAGPQGVTGLVRAAGEAPSGRYILGYSSRLPSDFGRAYLPLEAEAVLYRRSGRDEAGYFGPLEF